MASLGSVFNARSVEPIGEMGALPPGWYQLTITKSEKKGTKAKDGEYHALEYSVVNNEKFKNRKIFENLNLNNKNAAAVEIAQRTLSALCYATGQFEISDTNQLHNIPFWGKVAIEAGGTDGAGRTYNDSNSIIGYKSVAEFDGVGVAEGYGQTGGAPALNTGSVGGPGPNFNPALGQQPQFQQAPVNNAPVNNAPQFQQAPVQQAPVQQVQPVFTLTAKCQGSTEQDFINAGWTREQMVEQEYAIWATPQPAQQVPVNNAPQAPVNNGQPTGQQPAWLNNQQAGNGAPVNNAPQLTQPSEANSTANPPWLNQAQA